MRLCEEEVISYRPVPDLCQRAALTLGTFELLLFLVQTEMGRSVPNIPDNVCRQNTRERTSIFWKFVVPSVSLRSLMKIFSS